MPPSPPPPPPPLSPPDEIDAGPVLLRPWRADDVEPMARAVADSIEELRPWMPWAAAEPLSLPDRARLIAESGRQWERGESYAYGMYADGVMVGCTGLHPRIGAGGIEIGYWVRTAWTGRGIATATSRALTTAAFTLPGIERVEIHHDKANAASRRIPEKLGFALVAEVPDAPLSPGAIGIECRWRMTRAAWRERDA
jgi:RimJ/RimL family protein N-acetyltransferase